jgi:hypothetical protein
VTRRIRTIQITRIEPNCRFVFDRETIDAPSFFSRHRNRRPTAAADGAIQEVSIHDKHPIHP